LGEIGAATSNTITYLVSFSGAENDHEVKGNHVSSRVLRIRARHERAKKIAMADTTCNLQVKLTSIIKDLLIFCQNLVFRLLKQCLKHCDVADLLRKCL